VISIYLNLIGEKRLTQYPSQTPEVLVGLLQNMVNYCKQELYEAIVFKFMR